MTKLVWIEMDDLDGATQLTEMLESSGVEAELSRSLRGEPEVLIQKPRLRRMKPFVDDVQLVVRRWLEEHAPGVTCVRARTADERFEIRNPFALPARVRAPHASSV
jgi:hypothetical protein